MKYLDLIKLENSIAGSFRCNVVSRYALSVVTTGALVMGQPTLKGPSTLGVFKAADSGILR